MEYIKDKLMDAEFALFELRNACMDERQVAMANRVEDLRVEVDAMLAAFD